jgi:sodium transport system permease protein
MKWIAIFTKEMTDALRDRKALTTALSFALLGPVALVLMINVMAAAARPGALEPVSLCGKGQAPALVEALSAAGLRIEEGADICLGIPEDFEERLRSGRQAQVEIVADLGTAGSTIDALENEVGRYSRTLASQRLMSRGVAPLVVSPIEIEVRNTNTASRSASTLGSLIILYLVYAPFIIVASMASDTTAGERERRSLEPLLSHPVGYLQITFGKLLALAAVNIVGTAACIAISLLILGRSAAPELGLRLQTGLDVGLVAVLQLVPLCVMVAAGQLYLGFLSRSFKDAQQTMMLASIVPVMVGLVLVMRPETDASFWPIAWEIRALQAPLLGSNSATAPFALVALVELAVAAVLVVAGAQRLRSERVLA